MTTSHLPVLRQITKRSARQHHWLVVSSISCNRKVTYYEKLILFEDILRCVKSMMCPDQSTNVALPPPKMLCVVVAFWTLSTVPSFVRIGSAVSAPRGLEIRLFLQACLAYRPVTHYGYRPTCDKYNKNRTAAVLYCEQIISELRDQLSSPSSSSLSSITLTRQQHTRHTKYSTYILVLKFNDFSRTFKDPLVAFSRTNSRRKFTAWTVLKQHV